MPYAALLVVWPVAEIVVLVLAGASVGFWPVVVWLIAAGMVGAWLMRLGGRQAAAALQSALSGKGGAVSGGAMTVFSGVLLILPGLIGDVFALALLLPPVQRMVLSRIALVGAKVGVSGGVWTTGGRPGSGYSERSGVIDGDYEVISDRKLAGPDSTGTARKPDQRH